MRWWMEFKNVILTGGVAALPGPEKRLVVEVFTGGVTMRQFCKLNNLSRKSLVDLQESALANLGSYLAAHKVESIEQIL
jgi:hypothetical protein